MLKYLLNPPGVALSLIVCLPLSASAGMPGLVPAIPSPLLQPSYGYWINEADCVEEPADVRPAALPAAAAAPTPTPAPPTWQLRLSDQTLKAALLRWAASEGWQLVWEAPVDYAVERDTSIGGSLEQAIEAVARSMAGAETPLQAIFYKGNRVIRIVVKGAQS
ncbi:toxin co-regulated pilus biosynthesis Q family protein [Duganella vulcania]|uniref:Toxin co-regulated pilus biosynthesis protein Q C-terminal domain-containing protein n=1 Tax=Duganella vulcania TaxID=2692166 RepID=A0A845GYF0_9BURK|nr:toxin co-regulated pilus biosynthesis Q family protein [Duganella vulcania]MYM99005.1 hypothetical protein [Duganella vulcania]